MIWNCSLLIKSVSIIRRPKSSIKNLNVYKLCAKKRTLFLFCTIVAMEIIMGAQKLGLVMKRESWCKTSSLSSVANVRGFGVCSCLMRVRTHRQKEAKDKIFRPHQNTATDSWCCLLQGQEIPPGCNPTSPRSLLSISKPNWRSRMVSWTSLKILCSLKQRLELTFPWFLTHISLSSHGLPWSSLKKKLGNVNKNS